MDVPLDGLMCGDFSNPFTPAVHPLFPKAGPTGQAPGWLPGDGELSSGLGLFFPGMEVGQGQLPWCCHSSRLSPSPCFKACAPSWLSRLSVT